VSRLRLVSITDLAKDSNVEPTKVSQNPRYLRLPGM
jgi:hypothetical protein